jgi:hypothetical protein
VITEHDLQEAIAECEGTRNPNASTCMKLAAFYTIKQHMFGDDNESRQNMYSFAPSPERVSNEVDYDGDSEFSQVINGKDAGDMWAIMDELMDTLQVINPKLYEGVMRKIAE